MRLSIFCLLLSAALQGEVKFSQFQSRDAWTLDNAQLRVTIMQSGGHIGEIVLKETGVNPLWVQGRPTIDAEQYIPALHEKLYGGTPSARLMSGLMGHNVCFPFWGEPSDTEFKAGMTYHGETGIVRWRLVTAGTDSITLLAELPESRTRFSRRIRVGTAVVSFEETAENVSAWDRPVGWCEHVTLGPPFLERGATLMDASLSKGWKDGTPGEFSWPQGMAETSVDLRKVRAMERSPGFVNHFLVEPGREYGFLAAVNPKSNLVFGYVFPRKEFPWLNVWESNSPEMLTRGLEFSNTPIHGTMKVLVKQAELMGTPVYDWLNGKSSLKKRYWAFSARVPADFQGVQDVRVSPGKIEVVERGTGKVLALRVE